MFSAVEMTCSVCVCGVEQLRVEMSERADVESRSVVRWVCILAILVVREEESGEKKGVVCRV